MTETATPAATQKPDSKSQLKKRRFHEGVTLPSGAVVTIVLPNLGQMIHAGTLPNELVAAALKQQPQPDQDKQPPLTEADLKQDWEFVEFVVPLTLHEPKIGPDEVIELDPMDITMLANFAARRIDIDAVGHQLGGLETQKSFRDHRGIFTFEEALASDS